MGDPRFRAARWQRAGASQQQLADLAAAHQEMTPDERAAEVDLSAELNDGGAELIAGTVAEVLERVGDDPEKAAVALSHEQAKPKPRAGVTEELTRLIEAAAAGGND
jgi:hypothetical protein